MTKCPECGILNPLYLGGQCQSCEAKRIDERAAQIVAGISQGKPVQFEKVFEKVCLACRHPGDWTDDIPFCSSCSDAGWDIAYARGAHDTILGIFDELEKDPGIHEHLDQLLALLLRCADFVEAMPPDRVRAVKREM